jgi:hypothetical protein
MRHVRHTVAAAIAVLACIAAPPASAAPPSGHTDLVITTPNQIFELDQHLRIPFSGAQVSFTYEVTVFSDALGVVQGTGDGLVSLTGAAGGAVPVTVSGKMSGSPAKPRAQVNLLFAGPISLLGQDGVGSGGVKLGCTPPLVPDPNAPQLDCSGRAHLCASARGVGHACASAPATVTIATVGGDWTIGLDLATDGTGNVTGTAHVTLVSTDTLDFQVSGKYSAKTDSSTLKFSGVGAAAKSAKLSLKGWAPDTGSGARGVLKFKIAGQTGSINYSPPAPPPVVMPY